ncbi:nuclear receptor-interacting protein 2 [Plectropomus leopardus]|uniref:nuclear receptor-interacting protein 2 n=1 Tax=Plectropomus leopardus TaxID=160734 RepID=UPI001C4BB751|nr:nuclear receptor-interacting protein 2 [Plectropomus leopardus]
MSEAKKGELAIRDKAILHQQRRLKQATQFTHKDSADLLPLDGLKRLGTSKDLQPHSIVQRRLLEGNITRLRGEARDPNARVRSPLADTKDGPADAEERSESTADDSTEERESLEESERSLRSDEEDDSSEAGARNSAEKSEGTQSSTLLTALVVKCKCCETEVKASINTGSQHNHISSSCCQRLGLVPAQDSSPCGGSSSVTGLQLQLGRQTVQCSAYVKEDEAFELCLGLHTLLELKCCLDLSSRVLKLQGCGEELPFLNPSTDSQCQHDTNENL